MVEWLELDNMSSQILDVFAFIVQQKDTTMWNTKGKLKMVLLQNLQILHLCSMMYLETTWMKHFRVLSNIIHIGFGWRNSCLIGLDLLI